ncbi:septum formation initiator family protein [Streptomyces globisporus]|uniref:FtsB family cell division protein n=1 Tax=Streptomyces globisporus TaxID=1908 RepID=UPI0036453072
MSKPAAPLKGRAARLARLMPSAGPSTAARTPFVLLVVLLLGGGLITLLLLNSALNEGSFRLSELKRDTTELTDEQQALQRDVDSRSQPDALEKRARELGMVPGGSPAFLNPDGSVHGKPSEATAPPPSPTPSPSASPDPAALRIRVRDRARPRSRPLGGEQPTPDEPRQVTQCRPRNRRAAAYPDRPAPVTGHPDPAAPARAHRPAAPAPPRGAPPGAAPHPAPCASAAHAPGCGSSASA